MFVREHPYDKVIFEQRRRTKMESPADNLNKIVLDIRKVNYKGVSVHVMSVS